MLNVYPIQIEFNPEDHTYHTENGKLLMSVTQLLKVQGLSPSFEGVPSDVLRKAAERGTAIHAEFEQIIKTKGDCVVFSDEARWFLENLYNTEDEWHAELIVWTANLPFNYAGTIDIIRITKDGRVMIYDIKTGKVHLDAVTWQLTLYAYGFAERYGLGLDVCQIELFCIDAKADGCKVIPIHPIKGSEVMRMLSAQAEGIPYISGDVMLSPASLARVEAFETLLKAVEEHKRQLLEEYELFQNKLMEAMQNNGVKTFETHQRHSTRQHSRPTTLSCMRSTKQRSRRRRPI